MTDKITVVATGKTIVGKGIRSFDTVLESLIKDARHDIHIAVYQFGSGAKPLILLLEEALKRGVEVTIISNEYSKQPSSVREKFKRMKMAFPSSFHLFSYDCIDGILHTKVFVFDSKKVIIGSANFTWRAMVNNVELGVLIEGSTANQILDAICTLETNLVE